MEQNGAVNEPSVEDLMSGDIGDADGFEIFSDDEMQDIQEHNEKMMEEQRRIAEAYAAVFSSQQGQEVLDDLLGRTVRESVYMPERDNPEMLGHIREGQNSIVRYISQRITQGKQLNKEDGE